MKRIDLRDNDGIGENGACSMVVACFGRIDVSFDAAYVEAHKLSAALKDLQVNESHFDSRSAGGKISRFLVLFRKVTL